MTQPGIDPWSRGPWANTNHYAYIYVVIHRQTVSLYQNSSVWLDTQNASSWDQNPPNFTLDLVSYRSAISTNYKGASGGVMVSKLD